MQNLRKFSDQLNKYFNENIRLSFVSIRNVIIITKSDDKFYEFDTRFFNENKNSLIALYKDDLKNINLIEKSTVKELCNKGVVDVKQAQLHYIARTNDGKVYSWGYSGYGVLGNGRNWKKEPVNMFKPELIKFPKEEEIIDIDCGAKHTLVLTSKGEVYGWGDNSLGQIGNRSNENVSMPFKIDEFNGDKVKCISCGFEHSMALTEKGHVYIWGEFGFLTSIYFSSNYPKLVEVENIIFEKICCSFNHNLLLSSAGDIYVYGQNESGQLGIGDNEDYMTPYKLIHPEKFIDIATHYDVNYLSLSCAQSKSGLFYVWGLCSDENNSEVVSKPKLVEFNSFNEIFAHYMHITHNSIEGPIIKLFDDIFTFKGRTEYKFQNEEYIAEGSYGQVFKVTKNPNIGDEFYAIKRIFIRTNSEKQIVRQLKEMETTSNILTLIDKRVVRYYDVWLQDYYIKNGIRIEKLTLYIQMELCDKNLTQIIDEIYSDSNLIENDSLNILGYHLVIEIFIQILEGLNYLHKHEIIHRDLKPDNIMFKIEENTDIFVKIGDFGLVAIHKYGKKLVNETVNDESEKQSHTTDIGDMSYAAPEVLDGKEYDTKADIYSLGRVSLDLFNIDKQSYEHDTDDYRNEVTKMMPKYNEMIHLWNRMLSENPHDRPDCDEIFKYMSELSLNEFEAQNKFIIVSKSYKNQESYVFKLLKVMNKKNFLMSVERKSTFNIERN